MQLTEAVRFLHATTTSHPRVAVVLGSGLGGFAEELTDRIEVPYANIPGWPESTAVGHAGKLVLKPRLTQYIVNSTNSTVTTINTTKIDIALLTFCHLALGGSIFSSLMIKGMVK